MYIQSYVLLVALMLLIIVLDASFYTVNLLFSEQREITLTLILRCAYIKQTKNISYLGNYNTRPY